MEFQEVFSKQMKLCEETLNRKKKEYIGNGSDRLSTFKIAAGLQKSNAKAALMGMMAKQIVSLYEMSGSRDGIYPVQVWEEKITDSINYLILLRALVEEK